MRKSKISHLSHADKRKRDLLVKMIVHGTFTKSLAKHHLKTLSKAIHDELKRRYPDKKGRLYGNINKGFTQSELGQFLQKAEREEVSHVGFNTMAYAGLRIGEAVILNINPPASNKQKWTYLDLQSKNIVLQTEKAGTCDIIPLTPHLYALLNTFVTKHRSTIEHHGGYVLFANEIHTAWRRTHVKEGSLRTRLRDICKEIDLDQSYAPTRESDPLRKPRLLHRLTPHSLRHHFGTHFHKNTGRDIILTSRALRHKSPTVTPCYVFVSQEELQEKMGQAFAKGTTFVSVVSDAERPSLEK